MAVTKLPILPSLTASPAVFGVITQFWVNSGPSILRTRMRRGLRCRRRGWEAGAWMEPGGDRARVTSRGSQPHLVTRIVAGRGTRRGKGAPEKRGGGEAEFWHCGFQRDGSGEGEGRSHPRGLCPPRCPQAGDGDISADTEPAPGWGCSPPKAGQALLPSGPPRTLSLRRSPVPSRDPSGDNDTAGGGTEHPGDAVGVPQGATRHPKVPQDTPRRISAAKKRAEGTPGDTQGGW